MEAVNSKYTKKIQDLYKRERKYENLLDEHQEIREDLDIAEEELLEELSKLERKYENLLDEHQAIKEDQEIEEDVLLSDCIKLAQKLPKRECLNFDNQYIKIHGYTSTVVCWHLDRWE